MPSSSSPHGRRTSFSDVFFLMNDFQKVNFLFFHVSRSKEVDWQPYFTTRLVDDFATHLRVFRKAQDRLAEREDKQSTHMLSASLTGLARLHVCILGLLHYRKLSLSWTQLTGMYQVQEYQNQKMSYTDHLLIYFKNFHRDTLIMTRQS